MRPRTRIHVGNHLVAALLGPQFRYPAVGIVHVAEDDRLGRAGLLARGHDLAVANVAVFLVGLDLGFLDALHAVAALLHHAARAHGHIGIAHQLQALGLVVGEEQEVEAPHLVGAVVRAVARAHAAVVDHHVQAFRRVHRGAHRANLLAGRVLAVLADHGLEVRARRGQIALEIGVDAQPLHVAADAHLLLAHHRNIVLGITAHDAGIAARAAVHVDRHGPGVGLVVRPVGEQRRIAGRRVVAFALVREIRIGLELVERGVADDAARTERLIGFERVVAACPAGRTSRRDDPGSGSW